MMILGIGAGMDGLRYPLDGETMKRLDMSGMDLFSLVEAVIQQLAETKALFNCA
jgi:hypothetical protein